VRSRNDEEDPESDDGTGDRRAMKMMLEGRGRGTGDGGRRGEKKSVSKIGATRCIHRGTFP